MNISTVTAHATVRVEHDASPVDSGDRGFADLFQRHQVSSGGETPSAPGASDDRQDIERAGERSDDRAAEDLDTERDPGTSASDVAAVSEATAPVAAPPVRSEPSSNANGGGADTETSVSAGLAVDDDVQGVLTTDSRDAIAGLAHGSTDSAPAAGSEMPRVPAGDLVATLRQPSVRSTTTDALSAAAGKTSNMDMAPSAQTSGTLDRSPAMQPPAAVAASVPESPPMVSAVDQLTGWRSGDLPVDADQQATIPPNADLPGDGAVGDGAVGDGPFGTEPVGDLADLTPDATNLEPRLIGSTTSAGGSADPAAARATPTNPASTMLERLAAQQQIEQLMARAEVRRLAAGGSPLGIDVRTDDLGMIRIEAVNHGDGLHLQLGSEHAATRATLERHLQELRDQLRHDGLGDTFVTVTDHGGRRDAGGDGASSRPNDSRGPASPTRDDQHPTVLAQTAPPPGLTSTTGDGGVDVRI